MSFLISQNGTFVGNARYMFVGNKHLDRVNVPLGQLFKRRDQLTASYPQLKELLQVRRVLLHLAKIPRGMLVVIPTVTRSNDLQFLLMKIRREHKRLDIPIGSDTDAPLRLHLLLQESKCLVSAGTLESHSICCTLDGYILWIPNIPRS